MKKLKYITFAIMIFFITFFKAEAKCMYGNETLNFTCEANGSSVYCSMGGTGANNYTLKDYSNVEVADTETCTGVIMRTDKEQSVVIAKTEVYLLSISNATKTIYGIKNPENTPLNATSIDEIDENAEAEKKLQQYNGKTCIYSNGVFKYTCTIQNGKPVCSLGCAGNNACKGNGFYWDNNSLKHNLNPTDFLKNSSFVCPANSEDKLGMCGTVREIDYTKSDITIYSIGLACSGYQTLPFPLVYSPNAKDDEGNPGHNNEETPTNPEGPSTPTTPETPSDDAEKDNKLDLDNFCQGKIQGVFTALGWIFFIVKILIPIILIVFGTIDLSKAVIASKDDEIKKSVKTLLIRVVAGIIIFFIPTILNMIVKMFNQEDVYSGTFMDCTSCMLDPTQESCATLMGGDNK